jgi:hypothetical protein
MLTHTDKGNVSVTPIAQFGVSITGRRTARDGGSGGERHKEGEVRQATESGE